MNLLEKKTLSSPFGATEPKGVIIATVENVEEFK